MNEITYLKLIADDIDRHIKVETLEGLDQTVEAIKNRIETLEEECKNK